MTGISIAIFALVAAVILYSVVRFRARPDDDSDGAPIHGNTTLEIAWTAVPAVLVTAVAVSQRGSRWRRTSTSRRTICR